MLEPSVLLQTRQPGPKKTGSTQEEQRGQGLLNKAWLEGKVGQTKPKRTKRSWMQECRGTLPGTWLPWDSLWGEHGKPQQLPAPIAARRRAAREALMTASAGSTYSDASGVCLRDIRWKYVVHCNELAYAPKRASHCRKPDLLPAET